MIPPLSSRLGRPLCFIQKPQAYGCYCLTEFQAHKVWQQVPLLLNTGRVSCKNQHMTETSLKGLLAAGEHLPSECRAEQGGQRGLVWMKLELKEWSVCCNGVKTILLALFRQLTANSQLSTWRDTTLLSTVLPQHTLETHLHASFKEQKLINASGCVYWR